MKYFSRKALFLTSGACAGLFVPSSSAQTSGSFSREVTPAPPGAAYTHTGCGDFDDDANMDAVYQLGSSIDVMIAPGFYEARMVGVAVANDFTTLKVTGPDRLVTVGTNGLQEWNMYAPTLPEGSSEDPDANTWAWQSTTRGTSAWNGATTLCSWTNAVDDHYMVALDSAGTSLLTTRRTGTASSGTWTAGPTINIGSGSVLDMVMLDRDGNGLPEIAIMRSTTLKMYSPWSANPSTVVYQSTTVPGQQNTAITRIRQSNYTTEWLAWLTTLTDGSATQKFKTYGRNNGGLTPTYGIGNVINVGSGMGVFSMVSGDIDADGADDLAVTHTSAWSVVTIANGAFIDDPLYSNPYHLPRFTGTQIITRPCDEAVALPATDNRAHAAIADVDNDGDMDVGMPIRSLSEFWFNRSDAFSYVAGTPTLVLLDAMDGATLVGEVGVQLTDDSPNHIYGEFNKPPIPDSAPEGTAYMEISVWSQVTTPWANPVAIQHYSWGYDEHAIFDVDIPGLNSSYDSPPGTAPGFQRIVYISAQVVIIPEGETVPAWAGPGAIVMLQAQDEQDFDYYRDAGLGQVHENRTYVNSQITTDDPDNLPTFEVAYPDPVIAEGHRVPNLGASVGNGGYVPCFPAPPDHPPRH